MSSDKGFELCEGCIILMNTKPTAERREFPPMLAHVYFMLQWDNSLLFLSVLVQTLFTFSKWHSVLGKHSANVIQGCLLKLFYVIQFFLVIYGLTWWDLCKNQHFSLKKKKWEIEFVNQRTAYLTLVKWFVGLSLPVELTPRRKQGVKQFSRVSWDSCDCFYFCTFSNSQIQVLLL